VTDPEIVRRLQALPVGTRVSIRRRLPDGRATDAVGDMLASDAEGCTVRTRRHGDQRIRWQDVVAGKPVPPPPVRFTECGE
jgi:N-acetylglutamate synthase